MLENIRVRYDDLQDRLLLQLRMGGAAPGEHHLHLTRRVWSRSRLDMQAMLDVSAAAPQQLPAQTRQAVSTAHHQALAAQARTDRNDAPSPPPVQQTQLVTEMQCGRRRTDGKWVLHFKLSDKAELSLILSDVTLHATARALLEQEARAGWGLPELPAAKPVLTVPATSELH